MSTSNHEFDSSRTCNYCGIAAERVGGDLPAENYPCPKRRNPFTCHRCGGNGRLLLGYGTDVLTSINCPDCSRKATP